MRAKIGSRVALLLALLAALVGCADNKRAGVTGQILVDNTPLAEGSINFFPNDGGPSIGAVVIDGDYEIPQTQGVVVGVNRVEIRGFRNTGRKFADVWDKTKMHDEHEPALGPEYNEKTTLTRDVHPGENVLNFELVGIKNVKK
jgi:hypothetical protein